MVRAPEDVAVDDRLRSEFIRKLVLRISSSPAAESGTALPRILVQFWDDACVPSDVQECLDSWDLLHQSGVERMVFDDSTALSFIEEQFSEQHVRAFRVCHHPAMRADYFRLCFMWRVGGLYVDADDVYLGQPLGDLLVGRRLKLHALCYDVPTGSMLDPFETAADGEDPDRIFYVNNNPLIAPPRHPLVERALARATRQVLGEAINDRDIQSMTGPGNLTISLVEHAVELQEYGAESDFALLRDWDEIAISKWPLDYRSGNRNWRNWVRGCE